MGKINNKDTRKVLVYRHRRLDSNEIFYVGIAVIPERPYSKKGRNKYWRNIVSKTNFKTEIISIVQTWEEACELENLLILEYGRKDINTGSLVNMTNGGDGAFGKIISQKTKDKMSKAKLGKKLPKEFGRKISKGKLGKPHSKEGKKKKVEALGKKVIDTSTGRIFESITEASIYLGKNPGVISRYLNGVRDNKTTLKFYNYA